MKDEIHSCARADRSFRVAQICTYKDCTILFYLLSGLPVSPKPEYFPAPLCKPPYRMTAKKARCACYKHSSHHSPFHSMSSVRASVTEILFRLARRQA
ncbi:hypothetical protein D3C73_859750 [compost metagenome]